MLKLLRNFDSDTFNHNPYLIEDEQLDVIDGRMKWCWQQMQERRQDVMDLLTDVEDACIHCTGGQNQTWHLR